MLDRTVLARGVHRLKDHEQCVLWCAYSEILALAQPLHVIGEDGLVLRFRVVQGRTRVGHFLRSTARPWRTAKL